DDGTSGGDGRREFVGDQVQRKIEGSDGEDRTDGKASDEAPSTSGSFEGIEREIFAGDAGALFGSDLEGVDGASDFQARGLDGLAGFEGDGAGEVFTSSCDAGGNSAEDLFALVAGEFPRDREGFERGADCEFNVRPVAVEDLAD